MLTGTYKPLGAWRDTANRALRYGPKKYGYDANKCRAACPQYRYFALQNNGWCSCDNDFKHATKYGRKSCGKRGGPWCNYIYQNLRAPVAPATMKIPAGRWFNLVGPGGLCVEASNRNGHRLVQRTCNHENDLQWQFIPMNGGYLVRNRNSYVIDNSGARNRNGNAIIGYRQHGKPNQIWAPQAVNGSTFLLRNPQTNRCMDATGRHANGRLYHLWSCSKGNKNQWFRLGNPQRRPVVRPTPRPMPRPMPRPIAIPDVVPAPITPAPMPQWGASYPIAFFKPTPGNIDMETLRN
jgi:hypothetical protein